MSSHFLATDRVLPQCKHGMRGGSHQPRLTLYTLQHSIPKPHAERPCFFRLVIPAKEVANIPCSHLISSEVGCMLTARPARIAILLPAIAAAMSRAAVKSHTCPLLLQGVRVIHNSASALSLEKVGGCYTKGMSLRLDYTKDPKKG
jgi:hypothetical protein